MSEPTFEERFQYELEQAKKDSKIQFERYQRIIDGREKAKDLDEIAYAHYFLAGEYEINKDYSKALFHAKESLKLYDQLDSFSSDYERQRYVDWIKSIESYSKD